MEPTEILDTPIPLVQGGFTPATGSNTNPVMADSGASAPTTQVDQKFPQAIIAQETISQSLNTATRRITADYTFESLGAISIDSPTHPAAGVKISGDGIAATDANGATIFSLDGATGDATFKGTVEAAGFTIADETGLHSLNNFIAATTTASSAQSTTSSSYTDITGQSVTFTLPRSAMIVILYSANILNDSAGADGVATNVCLNIDGTDEVGPVLVGTGTPVPFSGVVYVSAASSIIKLLLAGSHTLKLRFRSVAPAGTPTARVSAAVLNYIILGS